MVIGDIAILEEEKKDASDRFVKEVRVFKRTHINGVEMWISESKQYLKNIIEEEKNRAFNMELTTSNYNESKNVCNTIYSDYFNFNLDEPNCTFELDNDTFKCLSENISINQQKINKKEDTIKSLSLIHI